MRDSIWSYVIVAFALSLTAAWTGFLGWSLLRLIESAI